MEIEQGSDSPQFDGGDSAANTAQNQVQNREQSQPTPQEAKAIFDLDKAEKFLFRGKEYTREQLDKEFMMRSDYTKKTQELSGFRKEAQYYQNLDADLATIRTNPALAEQFRQIYPEKFHKFLDLMGVKAPETSQKSYAELPPEIQAKLERLENYVQSTEVSKIESQMDAQFQSLQQKYPEGNEDLVLARAQAYLDQDVKMTPDLWEKLWKQSHDETLDRFKKFKSAEFNKQKEANKKSHEPGPGGGIPGQAPRRETMAQATERAIREMKR